MLPSSVTEKTAPVLSPLDRNQLVDVLTGLPLRLTESLSSDFAFYVFNEHPLFSIFFAHPQHPYSRKERLVVAVCSLALSFFLTAATPFVVRDHDRFGKLYTLFVAPLVMLFWDTALMKAARCRCVQDTTVNPKVRHAVEAIGRAVLAWALMASMVLLFGGIYLVSMAKRDRLKEHFYEAWFMTTASSWVYGIPLLGAQFVFFVLYWHKDKQVIPYVPADSGV